MSDAGADELRQRGNTLYKQGKILDGQTQMTANGNVSTD